MTPESIDIEHGLLVLDPAWTKNRKPGLQPIPRELAQKLMEFGENGTAKDLYTKRYGRKDAIPGGIPDNPLLYVSTHPARELKKDLKAAVVADYIPGEGKVDFHGMQAGYR